MSKVEAVGTRCCRCGGLRNNGLSFWFVSGIEFHSTDRDRASSLPADCRRRFCLHRQLLGLLRSRQRVAGPARHGECVWLSWQRNTVSFPSEQLTVDACCQFFLERDCLTTPPRTEHINLIPQMNIDIFKN